MRQVVAYKRLLKQKKIKKLSGTKIALGRLQEVVVYKSNCKALTGKVSVFWIGGRLWKVVAYERWLHMDVRLYTKIV